jgi:hypothetical protein
MCFMLLVLPTSTSMYRLLLSEAYVPGLSEICCTKSSYLLVCPLVALLMEILVPTGGDIVILPTGGAIVMLLGVACQVCFWLSSWQEVTQVTSQEHLCWGHVCVLVWCVPQGEETLHDRDRVQLAVRLDRVPDHPLGRPN